MYLRLLLQKRKSPSAFLFVIPYFFTLLNAFFGFLSIIKSLENEYIQAAYFIILAALMDGIDGRLARKFGSSSGFGAELDSLCDAISFCLAPVILVYSWFPGTFLPLGTAILGMYLCAGLLRLARFNINTAQGCPHYFKGLPTTLAALCIASLVLSTSWLATHSLHFIGSQRALCLIVFTLATLMISSIPFANFKNYKISIVQLLKIFPFIFIVLIFLLTYPSCFLFLILGYIIYNVLYFLHFLIKKK
jgi:CDP-diacylglycerol--serine O-phosphatidyltransferase